MVALVLNWLIEDMVAVGLLCRLVYWAVELMVQSQWQQKIVIMMIFRHCIVGFS